MQQFEAACSHERQAGTEQGLVQAYLTQVKWPGSDPQTMLTESSEGIKGCRSHEVLFTAPRSAGESRPTCPGHFICSELMECTHAKQGLTVDNDPSRIRHRSIGEPQMPSHGYISIKPLNPHALSLDCEMWRDLPPQRGAKTSAPL